MACDISGRRVIVTGATGFVGRYLVPGLLSSGAQVTVITRDAEKVPSGFADNVTIIQLDLIKDAVDITAGAEIVFHCAGETKEHDKFYDMNVKGTKKLLEECTNSKGIKKFIYLSSVGVIGAQRAGYYDELAQCFPRDPYEKSKLVAEKLVFEYTARNGIDAFILRPSIIYGPGKGEETDSFLSLIRAIKKRYFRYIGSDKAVYNIIYVKDVVEALICLAGKSASPAQKVYHINDPIEWGVFVKEVRSVLGMGKDASFLNKDIAYIGALFSETLGVFGVKVPFSMSRYRVLTNKTVFNAEQIKKYVGFNLLFGNRNGIRETIQDYIDRGLI